MESEWPTLIQPFQVLNIPDILRPMLFFLLDPLLFTFDAIDELFPDE